MLRQEVSYEDGEIVFNELVRRFIVQVVVEEVTFLISLIVIETRTVISIPKKDGI